MKTAFFLAILLAFSAPAFAAGLPDPINGIVPVTAPSTTVSTPAPVVVPAPQVTIQPAPQIIEDLTGKLQDLAKNIAEIGALFLALWKLLHDHHDRVAELAVSAPPTELTPAEATQLTDLIKKKGAASLIRSTLLIAVTLLFLNGCGSQPQCPCPAAAPAHQCSIDAHGNSICK